MASKEQPATYTNRTYNVTKTAESASTKLDYDGVVTACDHILEVGTDQMTNVSNNISKVQLGKEVLCVEDKSLQGVVDEVSAFLKSLPTQGMTSTLDEIKRIALEKYNEIQLEYNNQAKEAFDAEVAAKAAAANSTSSN